MPLYASAAWLSHLASDPTFLASCWRVGLLDGTVLAVTNNTEDVAFNDNVLGVTADSPAGLGFASNVVIYQSSAGLAPSHEAAAAGAAIDNLNVQFLLDAGLISEADLHAGRLLGADVCFFTINYRDWTMGGFDLRRGQLGALGINGQLGDVDINALNARMQQATGDVTGDICRHVFGDAGCAVDLSGDNPGSFAYTVVDAEITSVVSNRQFTVASLATWPDDFFERGYIKFSVGANAGLSMDVEKFDGAGSGTPGRFTLRLPMFLPVVAGDELTAVGGCKKTWRACWEDHANAVNFAGEYKHPTTESSQRITSA